MKKLLILFKPVPIAILSLLIVSSFMRIYLYVNTQQLMKEFKNQNYREIYALDTLKISSRINALSSVINWVCIRGSVADEIFYMMEKGNCDSGLLQQKQEIKIPEANNLSLSFTIRLPKEVEVSAILFLIMQSILISTIIFSTKKSEYEKNQVEIKFSKIARQMSHDIRSPLATLNLINETMLNNLSDDYKILKNAILRINNISNNLLVSSIENRNVIIPLPKKQIVDLNLILKKIIEEKTKEYSLDKSVSINITTPLEALYVSLDIYEFQICISNIINNSIEAKKLTSPITVDVSMRITSANHALIEIIDNGSGIPEEILSNLGKKEITSKKRGNGLGVIHTFENFKSWGGEIKYESKLNHGTTILISLPLQSTLNRSNILLDNDELVRITWESVAQKNNLILHTFSSPEALFRVINTFDLNSNFYIDSSLDGNVKGETVAIELHKLGFMNIYMATGYHEDKFNNLDFIKGVRGKSPPWSPDGC